MQPDPVSRATSKWPMQLSIKKVECKSDCELRIIHFIIQSPSLFFDKYLREAAIFTQERSQEGEKRAIIFTNEQNIICSQTWLDDIAHEKTIICRQLFAGQVVGSRPKKRKKHLHRMIVENISSYFIDTHCSLRKPSAIQEIL